MNNLNNKSEIYSKHKNVENVMSPNESILSKQSKLLAAKDRSDVSENCLFLNECSSTIDKRQATAVDILKLYNENSFINDQNTSIYINRSSLVNSTVYHPLEDLSLAEVFYHDKSFFSLKSKSFYTELDKEAKQSIAPSEFQLSRTDPTLIINPLKSITITLNETDTIILFEMPQKVDDVRSPTGQLTKANNKRYERLIKDSNLNRQMMNIDTQTINVGVKNSYTQLSKLNRKNQGTYVNTWIMFDAYEIYKSTLKNIRDEKKVTEARFSHNTKLNNINEQLFHIYYNTRFREAVRVILRILASNTYDISQKLYKGLIKEDISSPGRKPTYELKLLWTYSTDFVKNRIVSAFAWNHVNNDLMAVGYGPFRKTASNIDDSDTKGLLLIWCAKNPQNPEYLFNFENPISALNWSITKPNWIAVGFYNGDVQVIDVSGETMTVVKKSSGISSPSYKPHWDIQWWISDNDDNETVGPQNLCDYNENEIYAVNQDGRILCYQMKNNFEAFEITRIRKIERQSDCIKCTFHATDQDIPIFEYAAALLLRRHPTENSEYFVGSEDGYIFRFSNNYNLQCPIDSFLAHSGSIYSLEFSPCCPKIFVTSGADRCIRIWCDGIKKSLITLSTRKAVVRSAIWSPINSVILATIIDDQICIWDLASKTYEPMSITFSPEKKYFYSLKFMKNGKQLVASDIDGNVFIFHLQGMPVANYDRRKALIKSIEQAMVLKPELLREFKRRINMN